MATSRIDYTAEAVEAARSVLLELNHLLGEYRDDIARLTSSVTLIWAEANAASTR